MTQEPNKDLDELKEMVRRAIYRIEEMTPVERAIMHAEQAASFVRSGGDLKAVANWMASDPLQVMVVHAAMLKERISQLRQERAELVASEEKLIAALERSIAKRIEVERERDELRAAKEPSNG